MNYELEPLANVQDRLKQQTAAFDALRALVDIMNELCKHNDRRAEVSVAFHTIADAIMENEA